MGKYQRGSIRKVGSSWEWRYRIRGVMHQESFSVLQLTNEGALWKHLEPAIVRECQPRCGSFKLFAMGLMIFPRMVSAE